jgi:hypothetical protein
MIMRHKSIRVGEGVERVIREARVVKNCSESEAIRLLILTGGEALRSTGETASPKQGGKP